MTLYLNKLEFPSPKDALCQFWLKSAQQFRRTISKCRQSIFFLFAVTSTWYTCIRLQYLLTLHLIKLECPSTKEVFCQDWLKLVLQFSGKRFFINFVFVFTSFRYYLCRYMAEIQPIWRKTLYKQSINRYHIPLVRMLLVPTL